MNLSHTMKMGLLVAAACVAAGGGAAWVVSKVHSSTAQAGTPASSLRPGVVGRSGRFGFAPPGGGGFDQRGPGLGFGRGGGGGLSAVATYLGLSTTDLFSKLQSGQTLAEIAKSTDGKSVSGLIAAMTTAQKNELAAAVKSGRITQAQADQLSTNLTVRITAIVNGQFGFRRRYDDGGTQPATPL